MSFFSKNIEQERGFKSMGKPVESLYFPVVIYKEGYVPDPIIEEDRKKHSFTVLDSLYNKSDTLQEKVEWLHMIIGFKENNILKKHCDG